MAAFEWPDRAFAEVGRITNDRDPNSPMIIYEPHASLLGFGDGRGLNE
jgi:hypothetical protein